MIRPNFFGYVLLGVGIAFTLHYMIRSRLAQWAGKVHTAQAARAQALIGLGFTTFTLPVTVREGAVYVLRLLGVGLMAAGDMIYRWQRRVRRTSRATTN